MPIPDQPKIQYMKRRSLVFYTSNDAYDSRYSNLWASMFSDDIGKAPMLSSKMLEISPNSRDSCELITSILNDRDYYKPAHSLEKFFTSIAHHLGYSGEAYFEILRSDVPERFILLELPIMEKYKKRGKKLIQFIPKESRDKTNGRSTAIIPLEDVWHLTLPRQFGKPKRQQQLINVLAHHGQMPPGFDIQNMTSGSSVLFKEYDRHSKTSIAKLTRDWGWSGRNMWSEECTEYALVYRLLKFGKNKRILLEYIIDSFNKLLASNGIDITVKYKGNTSSKYSELERKLKSGEAPFDEVLDFIYKR